MIIRRPLALSCIVFCVFLVVGLSSSTKSFSQCTDWSGVPVMAPTTSWDGPEFNDRVGGWVKDGYMMKNAIGYSEAYYEFYDIRDLAQPTLIYESYLSGEHGMGNLFIAATQDSLCVIGYGGPGGVDMFFVRASNPQSSYEAPFSGVPSLMGHKMFQVASSWLDGQDGVGYFDFSNIESITELGFFNEILDASVGAYGLSEDVVLVRNADGMVEAVDFQNPLTPVVRSEVSAEVYRWLGRAGDLVFFSDHTTFYALDVSDLDDLQIAYTIPFEVTSMDMQGDFAVLSFGSSVNERLRIYDLVGAGAPVAVCQAFGGYSNGHVSWDGNTVYTGDIAVYDVSDPSLPVQVGTAPFAGPSYVQDGYLVTGNGIYPTHCASVAAAATPSAALQLAAWPNPFNPRTEIKMETSHAGRVTLNLYDAQGSLVRRLVQDELPAGVRTVSWNGKDDQGRAVPAGVYFARLTTADAVATMKVTMVK